ncbi:peptidase [Burkholderia sp. IMCC1007]|uniref:peptidase n=1 Tax=Burkholderia sp. IMCC1007 TaxID=3004104 RepID=UPI0022B44C16|nr:peptidase [Burkholderia sp. IMCC1007]
MSFRPGTIRSPSAAECIAPARAAGLSRIELDPQRDRHARAALEAYADSAAAEMPWLAESLAERLRDAAQHDGSGFTYCNATVERVFDLAQAWAASQPDYAATAWERVRTELTRMLMQPAWRRRAAADDLAEAAVAGMAGAD